MVLTGRGGCANNEESCGVQGARSKLTVMNTPNLSLKFWGHWVVWLRVDGWNCQEEEENARISNSKVQKMQVGFKIIYSI